MPELTSILTLLLGGGGFAALLGWWLNRRRVPAEVRLLDTQASKVGADARQLADDYLLRTLEDSRETIDRLRSERNEARSTIERLLEEQKQRHDMVDELNIFRIRWTLLESGVSFEEVKNRKIKPLYGESGDESN